jgi:hypothetical protein
MIEQKPGADAELADPLHHRRLDVLDDIGHLNDAVVGLAKSYETHVLTSLAAVVTPRA